MGNPIFSHAVESTGQRVVLPIPPPFSLELTLDCGQAFRWEKQADGRFRGVAGKYFRYFSQLDNGVDLGNVIDEQEYNFWYDYFDVGRAYAPILETISRNLTLARAVAFAPGIRVLHQDPWEALCSFIISQNNHIPRIKGIIARLCAAFGEPLGEEMYTFPTPQALACLTPDDLAPLRAGFRARYLIDAAQKVTDGQVDLHALRTLAPEEARASLRKITGVGAKVAECTLLYGCGRVECFPVDVWIGRVMEELFPQGLPEIAVPWAGIAQQFLFHYIRFADTDK